MHMHTCTAQSCQFRPEALHSCATPASAAALQGLLLGCKVESFSCGSNAVLQCTAVLYVRLFIFFLLLASSHRAPVCSPCNTGGRFPTETLTTTVV